jgi:hypothetical protein
MSRQAYESYFGQSAPANALFGVDMAYPQAYSGSSTLDYNFCKGYWLDIHSWADFVCIRTSYGGSGDDGGQGLHFQIANELGYAGAKGCYHFVYAGPGVQANYNNFISKSDPFADQTTFDMMDYEAAPNVGDAFINQMCDMVEQRRQRTCFVYGGKGYLDAAGGGISCEADKLWIAHYAASGSNAMQPTTSWSSWGAPLMPNQYGAVMPGIWQWSSLTAQHGHLDLNISTLPRSAFGGSITPPVDRELFTVSQYDDIMFRLNMLLTTTKKCKMISARGAWWMTDGIGVVPFKTPQAVVDAQGSGFLSNDVDASGNPIPQGISDDLFDTMVRYDLHIDANALADSIAAKITPVASGTDYEKIRSLVHDELGKMNLTQK